MLYVIGRSIYSSIEDLPGLVTSVPTYYQGVAGSNPVAGLTLLVKRGLFGFLKIT